MIKWQKIEGFDNYEVNELGQVRNSKTKRILETANSNDYRVVCLRKGNENYVEYVHIIVAKAFIPNPENKPTVNHKNGDKAKNTVDNLEWATHAEQTKHAWAIGLCKSKNNPYISNEDLIGMVFPNNKGESFTVLRFYKYDKEKALNYFIIRFDVSGNEKIVVKSAIQYGNVADYTMVYNGRFMERKDIIANLKTKGIKTEYIEKKLSIEGFYDKDGIKITKANNYKIGVINHV